jgi:hypothetical protein
MKAAKPIRIIRPAGRRTRTEARITNYLVGVGETIQAWLIDNNRVATGKSMNSMKVKITRQARPDKALATARREGRRSDTEAGQAFSDTLKDAQKVLNAANLGLVAGQLVAAPSLNYALHGRPAGKPPPTAAIRKWMIAKGVEPKHKNINQSAYLIARKIGAKGTNKPHFEQRMVTQLVRVSMNRAIHLIAKPLAKTVGRKFVRFLLQASKDYDNMTMSHQTITLFNEAADDFLGSNITGTNPTPGNNIAYGLS